MRLDRVGKGRASATGICAVALLLSSAGPAIAQSMRPRDVDALASKPADVRLAYGGDSLQFGELRIPKGAGPHPLAIVIHGGCWVSHFASLQNTAALSDALRDRGVATWNVEYRRLDHPGGGWPGTYQDVAAAADFVRTFAARYHIDTTRVISMGHSAGGHLALWLAGRKRLAATSVLARSAPLRLFGVADIAGPGDIADFSTYDSKICGDPVIEQLMGGAPAKVPDRYAQGSPRQLLPLGVRQVVIVGAADPVMPQRSRDAYAAAARAAGDSVEVVVISNAGHFEVIAPTSSAWPTVADRVLSLVGMRPR